MQKPTHMRNNMKTNSSNYTITAIVLHWLIVLLIVPGFCVGLYMVELKLSPEKLQLYSYHKWIGVTVLWVTVLRLLWRSTHRVPPLPDTTPRWQKQIAGGVHILLYILIVALPLSGWMFSSASGYSVKYLGVFPLPDFLPKDKILAESLKELHETLAWGLASLVALHAAAALKHYFVDKDNVLQRMLPFLPNRAP